MNRLVKQGVSQKIQCIYFFREEIDVKNYLLLVDYEILDIQFVNGELIIYFLNEYM